MMDYQVCEEKSGTLRRATLRQRLEARLNDAKQNVEKTETALKLLDENPTFEKIQNAITDLGL